MKLGHFDRHINSRCSTVIGSQPRSGKSVTTSWTTTLANCHDKPTVDWGDMISKSIRKSLDKSDRESDEFYKEVFTERKVNDMGLRIKKTDVLSIDEFKENEKAYDEVKINIDDEKLKKFEDDYGVYDFTIYLCKYVKICDEVIEFLPKALCIGSVHCVPYSFIENIECTYYLKTE